MFPMLLYKSPGPHRLPGGKTYGYTGCPDAEAFERLTEQGWCTSREEAITGKHPTPALEAIDEETPPTRAEMEAKAKELGLKFNHRTRDEKLFERITEALG